MVTVLIKLNNMLLKVAVIIALTAATILGLGNNTSIVNTSS